MEHESLKVLLIGTDEPLARGVGDLLREGAAGELATVPTINAGLPQIRQNVFDAALLELPAADEDGLSQITLLAVQAPHLPVIVLGPTNDERFAAEAVRSGAQDYLPKEKLEARELGSAIRCAMERQRERAALIEEKDNYCGVFDHLVEGIFRTTADGHYLLANVALARIYGYDSPVELMASIKDIGARLYVEPGRRDEFIRLMREQHTIVGFESQVYRKDGTIIWISENVREVNNAEGQLLYYEGTVENITQQREIEERMRASEALYHSLVETMPQNIFRKDLQGRYTFANRQFCKTLGKPYDEVIGKTIADFTPHEHASLRRQDDQKVITSGQPFEAIEESVFSNEPAYIQVVKIPIFDANGKVAGVQGMFWDITEQKMAAEKIRQANAELAHSREVLRSKNQVMEENLRTAHEIQLTMLPQQYPVFPPGVPPEHSAFQFVHRYLAAESVSGDFFSVSAISDFEVGVFICDVTGHGVRAALVTAMIRALAEELKPFVREPGNFLGKLNYDLCNILKNTGSPMLTTAFYLVADSRTGVMRYANAGHPKPLCVRAATGQVEQLVNASGKSQPALGLFDESPYQTSETTLGPGDVVMLFTDGLFEVQGSNEELYSQQRLLADVGNLIHKPVGGWFDELLEAIRAFAVDHQFGDDVCMVGMKFAGKPAQQKI